MFPLEVRRLLTIDLIASTTALAGYYGPLDGLQFEFTFSNIGSTSTDTGLPFFPQAFVTLTKDKVIGNADDIPRFAGTTVAEVEPGTPVTDSAGGTFDDTMEAGDYYIATIVDEANAFEETNEANNVSFSKTASVRIVQQVLASQNVTGTAGHDKITIEAHSNDEIITINGISSIVPSSFPNIFIEGGTGNDRIFVTNDQVLLTMLVTGGGGNDTIIGGNNGDELSGANGKDKVFGGPGDDYLLGGAAGDYLNGEAGSDTMSAAGGNDRLSDTVGRDHFLGGAGNDVFICRDLISNSLNDPDTVSGGSGADRAQVNTGSLADGLASIEELLA